jgi:hypothetical protein
VRGDSGGERRRLPRCRRNPFYAGEGRRGVVDLQETPAVPDTDSGGDVRIGYFVAGGLLIAVGWGVALVLNAVLHAMAPPGGLLFYGLRVGAAWGPQGTAVAIFGGLAGAFGVVLLALGRASPRGPFVLPGAEY